MKKIIQKSLLLLICCFSSAFAVGNPNNPVTLLNSIADQMIADLKTNKATLKSTPNLVYKFADQVVVPHADLDVMSTKVLPPQIWAQATPAQRAEFKKEFTKLLVRTYASALADYNDQTIQFFPVRGGVDGKTNVNVNSKIIRSDGPPISVNYSMIRRGSTWKLYDMTVEGISMLESFRSQFADKLSQGDMANLITQLKAHNAKPVEN